MDVVVWMWWYIEEGRRQEVDKQEESERRGWGGANEISSGE